MYCQQHHVLQCVQGSTSALVLVSNYVYVFDSHSKNEAREQVPSGTEVLLKFLIAVINIAHIYEKCGFYLKVYDSAQTRP